MLWINKMRLMVSHDAAMLPSPLMRFYSLCVYANIFINNNTIGTCFQQEYCYGFMQPWILIFEINDTVIDGDAVNILSVLLKYWHIKVMACFQYEKSMRLHWWKLYKLFGIFFTWRLLQGLLLINSFGFSIAFKI